LKKKQITMTESYDEDENWVSKTRRKHECDDMQELGEKMITLNKEELSKINMDDELRRAIEEAQRMKSNGALKRQRQYIGKIIRNLDDETLEPQLNRILHMHDIHNAEFKRMEKWREAMMEGGDDVINNFMEQYPLTDRHHLRQLIRNAKKEKQNNKPPAAYRQIFKYIREISEQTFDNNGNED